MKTEADASITDITECSHDEKPTVGMFGLSDVVFSAVICLSVTLCQSLTDICFESSLSCLNHIRCSMIR